MPVRSALVGLITSITSVALCSACAPGGAPVASPSSRPHAQTSPNTTATTPAPPDACADAWRIWVRLLASSTDPTNRTDAAGPSVQSAAGEARAVLPEHLRETFDGWWASMARGDPRPAPVLDDWFDQGCPP